jgi:hypothetical protein
MQDLPVDLDCGYARLWMLGNCKNGISSYQIARDLDVTQKTAWFLLHRIPLSCRVDRWKRAEGDETFVGGEPKNGNLEPPLQRDRRARPGYALLEFSEYVASGRFMYFSTQSLTVLANFLDRQSSRC